MHENTRQMGLDEQRCFDSLSRWKARLDTLIAMYDKTGPTPHVPAALVAQARESYKRLKNDLLKEYTRLIRNRRRTAAEQSWYLGALYRAFLALNVSAISRPEKWYESLRSCWADFASALFHMRSHFGVREAES